MAYHTREEWEEMWDNLINRLGHTEMLNAVVQSFSTDELSTTIEFIDRYYDTNVVSDYEEESYDDFGE